MTDTDDSNGARDDGAGGDRYEIDGVAFIGRTFPEYARMFGLDGTAGSELARELSDERVLDCPGGACSFRAAAATRNAEAWAVDPVYGRVIEQAEMKADGQTDTDTGEQTDTAAIEQTNTDAAAETPIARLARIGGGEIRRAMDALDGVTDQYRWEYYPDRATLERHRWAALGRFLADYPTTDRYVAGALPTLPFPDDTFDLTLSAHLLFLYADRFDHAFHVAALQELCRVTRGEVRVFPLVDFGTERYDRLPELCETLRRDGHEPSVESVDFEFQRGADEVLVVDTE